MWWVSVGEDGDTRTGVCVVVWGGGSEVCVWVCVYVVVCGGGLFVGEEDVDTHPGMRVCR